MRLAVAVAVLAALLAAAPAHAAEVLFGASPEQLSQTTPESGATPDCASGCLFASEPEHGPLGSFPPFDDSSRFPIRLDRAEIRLKEAGEHQLHLLVLSSPATRRFTVKQRIALGTHGPGLVNALVSGSSRTVCAARGDWIGLHIVHAGQTSLIERGFSGTNGNARRAVGVSAQVGDTVDAEGTYGNNRILPARVYADDDPAACGGGSEAPGQGSADLQILEQHTLETTGDQRVGRAYAMKATVRNNGPDTAIGVRSGHFEPNVNFIRLLGLYTPVQPAPFPCGYRQATLPGDNQWLCVLGDLAPGQEVTVRFRSFAIAPGEARPVSTVASQTPDPDAANDLDGTKVRIRSTAPPPSGQCDSKSQVIGSTGDDTLTGGKRGEIMRGLAGKDLLRGGLGADCMFGEEGKDRLDGDAGNDRMDGGADADRLDGDAGNDAMNGGDGKDVLNGGAGADRIDVADRDGGDRVTCGAGFDRVNADPKDKVASDCESVR